MQVARGYRNLPEQTAQKFITHPQFGRLYRRITAVTGVVIVFVLVLLTFTLTKWWRYLFGF